MYKNEYQFQSKVLDVRVEKKICTRKENKKTSNWESLLIFSFSFYFRRRIHYVHICLVLHRFLLSHPPSTLRRIVASLRTLATLTKSYYYYLASYNVKKKGGILTCRFF